MNFRLVEIEKLKKVETKKLGDSHEGELLKFIEIYNFGGFFVVKYIFHDIILMVKKYCIIKWKSL
jgi:hypothetical protein